MHSKLRSGREVHTAAIIKQLACMQSDLCLVIVVKLSTLTDDSREKQDC